MTWRLGSLTMVAVWGLWCAGAGAAIHRPKPQGWSGSVAPAMPAPQHDPALADAQALIGRALFLRGSYAGGELTYDVLGKVQGQPKQLDWTLAAVNVVRVSRQSGGFGAGELELDGVRVAIRYNTDQHVFERHPLKDEKLKILLTVNDGARGLQGALATMFAVGIDPALQRSLPPYWRHYFAPATAWPSDELANEKIVTINAAAAGGVEFPALEKKLEPDFTNEARLDKVKGTVQLKMVVGTDGVPRRIVIRQPLGYGLDAKAAETAAKLRFKPGMQNGKPIAVEMLLNQAFDVYAGPK